MSGKLSVRPSGDANSDPSADQTARESATLVSTKGETKAARREERRAAALDEVTVAARQARERRCTRATVAEGSSAEALSRQVLDGVDVVLKVATKSGNLKGTFIRALKEAAEGIQEAVEALLTRTTSEETAILQQENCRLTSRIDDLERRMAALSSDLDKQRERSTPASAGIMPAPETAPGPAPAPEAASVSAPLCTSGSAPGGLSPDQYEQIVRAVALTVGGMTNARLEALEPRLNPATVLRPPLAADARRRVLGAESPREAGRPGSTRPMQVNGTFAQGGRVTTKKPTGQAKKPAASGQAPTLTDSAVLTAAAPALLTEGWVEVAKRGTVKKTSTPGQRTQAPGAKNSHAPKADRRRRRRTKVPHSAAVVITLQPGAAERGLTYRQVLSEARAKVEFPDLGRTGRVRFRTAITGARLYELSGTDNALMADALAARLKEAIPQEDARISRPVKTAEMRIDGMDDYATPEEVVAAIATEGGCTPDSVRVGIIRSNAVADSDCCWTRRRLGALSGSSCK